VKPDIYPTIPGAAERAHKALTKLPPATLSENSLYLRWIKKQQTCIN